MRISGTVSSITIKVSTRNPDTGSTSDEDVELYDLGFEGEYDHDPGCVSGPREHWYPPSTDCRCRYDGTPDELAALVREWFDDWDDPIEVTDSPEDLVAATEEPISEHVAENWERYVDA